MEKMKFEDALLALEDIVRQLEGGNLSLDESISEFERAVKLVKLCTERLDAAEQKVKILVSGEDGTVTDKPFDIGENEN